ncbi:uncharacterized protein LOC112341366 [Selaginella moellendorffii]|uniref:uncharacterized protein LOC112341366 n=1 Tax=Selaginella moellendorffii TaxID=88036 RepID=UPI000D1C3676|nr:uncharacterized protein LOC112341366 [Selaginella moellendorffii]|eukprot:XP_024517084.1 uncharacterized protein LOC112341366 [Selaginella moellendorffii]
MWRSAAARQLFQRSLCSGHGSLTTTQPAPRLVLHYDKINTSLILFDSSYYSIGSHGWLMKEFGALLALAHRGTKCTIHQRKHCNSSYWSCPYSRPDLDYDPDMPPSVTELMPCQIESIEATGCLSTFELGIRYKTDSVVISDEDREIDRAKLSKEYKEFMHAWRNKEINCARLSEECLDIWHNRVPTNCVLLSVPSKALKYKALQWNLERDFCNNFPLEILPHEFVTNAASSNTRLKEKDAILELGEAVLQGIRRCVVVDLRGIGIMKKVGLFLPGATVDKLRGIPQPGPGLAP